MRIALFALVVAAALAVSARRARAQCGETPSSCWSCHEVQGARPVLLDPAPWHRDHAFADLCSRCHGGDPLVTEEPGAHAGRVDPMADPRATCGACHTADADARAAKYAAAVRETPNSSSIDEPSDEPFVLSEGPATRRPPLVLSEGPEAPSRRTTNHPPFVLSEGPEAPSRRTNDRVLAILVIAIGVLGASAITIVERRRRGHPRARIAPLAFLARPAWSPYLAGALLGVVVTISLAVFGRRLSGAGAYQSLSGVVGERLAPHAVYWSSIVRTGLTWDVWLLIGTFAGAFASALVSRQVRVRTMPDARWIEAFGPRVLVRWLLVFVGTALLSIAAGIAGGCTASLVLSGGAVLSPGAFVFMAAMFAGGIPVGLLVGALARRHRGGRS